MQRALVVDDNRPLAEDLAEILSAEGYEVQIFDDPRRAAESAGELRFDLALLDLRMPGIDGLALLRILAERQPGAHFVLMTAYLEENQIAEAHAAGARRVLPKPVPIQELLEMMAELEA